MVYDASYDSPNIRADSESVPYDVSQLLRPYLAADSTTVDVGCGTCRKLMPLSSACHAIYGIDNNEVMLSKATDNIVAAGVANIYPRFGHAFYLPFGDGSLDIASCMLAPYCIPEMHRVLKPGGTLFMELLGVDDKKALKTMFSKDDIGWRGILLNVDNDTREDYLYRSLTCFFSHIEIRHFKWVSTINYPGLLNLLHMTPTIRDFDAEEDSEVLHAIRKQSATGIRFEEHRMIITAKRR